jgi:hypothetical protein
MQRRPEGTEIDRLAHTRVRELGRAWELTRRLSAMGGAASQSSIRPQPGIERAAEPIAA